MRYILLFCLILTINTISAQKDPIKWKEIPIEDLKMKSYASDTSANAVVLCDYGQYYFDTNPNGRNIFLFNKRYVRIKILKAEGCRYAKISIPFVNRSCEQMPRENSIIIKGMVYNLSEKGEIETKKLKAKNITYRDSTDCLKVAEFSLPDVKPGSVIDYYYEQPTLDFVMPQSWYFQWEIPVRHSEFRMRVPRYYQYMFSSQNFDGFEVAKETNYSKTLMFNVRTRYWYNRTYQFDLSGKQMQFVKENIEAFENQGFVNNPEHFMMKLNIHLVRATNENFGPVWEYLTHALYTTTVDGYEDYEPIQKRSIIYPAGYILYSLPDWEKFAEKLLKSDRFGLPIIKYWENEEYIADITKGKNTDFDKMVAIYDYMRKNIKWSGEYDIYVKSIFNKGLSWLYTKITKKAINEKSLRKPFENQLGSSSEINLILISLLNKAGIETHPVILSTCDNGEIDVNIPDPKQFNHVIALAKIGDENYFLDAIDSMRPYNLLSDNDIGRSGFLVEEKNFGWVEIENKTKTHTNIVERINLDSNLNFLRSIDIEKSGYDALETRKSIGEIGKEQTFKNMTKELGDYSITEIENLDKDEFPVVLKAMKNRRISDNEILIFPKIDPIYTVDDFIDIVRKFPVEFNYPFGKNYSLQISLPEGYECVMPSDSSFSTYGGNAFYSYKSSKIGNTYNLFVRLKINKMVFPAVEYSNLKQIFTELNEKLEEPIIIRKIK